MTTDDLHNKFTEYGRNAKEWQRKCLLLLPEIEKRKVWQIKNFNSIYEYAAKLAGLSFNQIRDALRILNHIKDKPELMKVAEEKGVNAVRPVSAISTKENAAFWAEKATKMNKPELEAYIRTHKAQTEDNDITNKKSDPAAVIAANLKPKTLSRLAKHSKGDADALINKLLDMYEKELTENKPKPVQSVSRHIPKAIQNYVALRSNGKCEFPGCHRKHEHFHHSNRFATNKIHDPNQIFSLCSAHHNLVHHGLIDEKNWQIRREPDLATWNNFIDQKVQHYRRR